MRLFFTILVLALLIGTFAMGAAPVRGDIGGVDVSLVTRKILKLHEIQGPAKKNIVWGECGKQLRGKRAVDRATDYAKAIGSSIEAVNERTGEWIDYRHVVAIMYRESSHNECVIGKQETNRLREQLGRTPKKKEVMEHVRRWSIAHGEGRSWCRKYANQRECVSHCVNDLGRAGCAGWCERAIRPGNCVKGYVKRVYPEYARIRGWDIGAAQYRWPRNGFGSRKVVVPDGREVNGIGLSELMTYNISIQMLVEDLAEYKVACKGHRHYHENSRGRRVRELDVEEAYFVHHHTGTHRWSHRYWRAVRRHLKVMDAPEDKSELVTMLKPFLSVY